MVSGGFIYNNNSDLSPLLAQLAPIQAKSLVINVKDADGLLAAPFATPRKYGLLMLMRPNIILNLHEWTAGLKTQSYDVIIYLIVFKDRAFASLYPEEAIKNTDGTIFDDGHGVFIDPASTRYHTYLFDLLNEIADDPNVTEIMLDYVRYPEYWKLKYPHPLPEDKRQSTLLSFVEQAAAIVHAHGKKISLSVFPPKKHIPTPFGQDYLELARRVDIMSPMIYPDLDWGVANEDDWKRYFEARYQRAQELSDKAGSSLRPWIQGFQASWQATDAGKKQVYLGPLPYRRMLWQVRFLTERDTPFLVFNSRSEYDFDK